MGTAFFLIFGNSGRGGKSNFLDIPVFTAIISTLGLAAALSFFHLGRPRRAVFVLKNLRRSWLSREIFFELMFLFLVVLLAFLARKNAAPTIFFQGLVILAAITGFGFLISMSKLYMLTTVPVWRSLHTPLSFFLAAALLGPLGAASAQSWLLKFPERAHSFQNACCVVSLAAIVMIVLTTLLFTPGAGFLGARKTTLLEFPVARMYPYLVIRLLFLGAATLFLILYHKEESGRFMTLAFLSASLAEVSGRYLFFAFYSRLGV